MYYFDKGVTSENSNKLKMVIWFLVYHIRWKGGVNDGWNGWWKNVGTFTKSPIFE